MRLNREGSGKVTPDSCNYKWQCSAVGRSVMEVFASQVAIVTGGAQGLGESASRMLARNGCSVMIFDTNEEKARAVAQSLQTEFAGKVRFEACVVDVSDEASVQAGFQTFRSKFDRLDIMVNCAGILGPSGVNTEAIEVADFDKVYAGIISLLSR